MAAKKGTTATTESVLKTNEQVEDELIKAQLESLREQQDSKRGKKRIGLLIDTPYCVTPDANTNIGGILKAGDVYTVYGEINSDDEEKGSFYDIGLNRYINKVWNVEVFEVD